MTQISTCNDPIENAAINVAIAVDEILLQTKVLTSFEQLSIRDCYNRVLFEDIISPINVPGHDNSAMDGYALHSRNIPQQGSNHLTLAGIVYAGKPLSHQVAKDQCVRIMTGAKMPENTDTVIAQEDIVGSVNEQIEFSSQHKKNQNVRFAGEDIKQGSIVLSKGHRIKSADLGLLASLGIAECRVYRKPKVCFFSTGDELKSIGETLESGDIYDSNRYSLFGLLKDADVEIVDMGVLKDDPQVIKDALLAAADSSDVILTSGGVSVGEADYIKGVLDEIGSMNFWKIAMKPGRPLTFGEINQTLFFGLPGNPVAVMVTFYEFVLPCLKKLAGKKAINVIEHQAIAVTDIRKNSNRREFQRGIAFIEDGNLHVQLTGRQGSGILSSMSQANCMVVLTEEQTNIKAGDQVLVRFFDQYFN